jgi:CheY-like chemotaxis protein
MMIRSAKTLLVVEDNPGDARLLGEMLREDASCTLDLVNVTSMIDAEIYLAEYDVEIILLDLGLPDASGLDAVRRAHTAAPNAALWNGSRTSSFQRLAMSCAHH